MNTEAEIAAIRERIAFSRFPKPDMLEMAPDEYSKAYTTYRIINLAMDALEGQLNALIDARRNLHEAASWFADRQIHRMAVSLEVTE